MEQTEAQKITQDADELQDLQDDQVVHNLEDEITKDIQKDKAKVRTKKPRSPAQIAAFKKAQAKLKEKREAARATKMQAEQDVVAKTKTKTKVKRPPRVIEVSESSEEEEEVVYVQRRKPRKKQKPKPMFSGSSDSTIKVWRVGYIV